MKYLITLIITVTSIAGYANQVNNVEPDGVPSVENFEYSELVSNIPCSSITVSKKGFVYASTNNSILEYDGNKWRKIACIMFPRVLQTDSLNRIFYANSYTIGYLKPDSKGVFDNYTIQKFKEEKPEKVRHIFTDSTGAYFIFKYKIIRWNNGKITEWKSKSGHFVFLSRMKGKLRFLNKEFGVQKIVEDSLVTVISTKDMYRYLDLGGKREKVIDKNFPFGAEKQLFFKYSDGLLYYENYKMNLLVSHKKDILHSEFLDNGDIAINNFLKGLMVVDRWGHIKQTFSSFNGLSGSYITDMCKDNSGNLWLSTTNGVTRIDFSNPYPIYDGKSGLFERDVTDVIRHKSLLYVGTRNGIFLLNRKGADDYTAFQNPQLAQSHFTKIKNFNTTCHHFVSRGDVLLVAARDGIYQIKDNRAEKIKFLDKMPANSIWHWKHSNVNNKRVYLFTTKGLASLYFENNRYYVEGFFKGLDGNNFREDPNGDIHLISSYEYIIISNISKGRTTDITSGVKITKEKIDLSGFRDVRMSIQTVLNDHLFYIPGNIFKYNRKRKEFEKSLEFGIIPDDEIVVKILGEDIYGKIWMLTSKKNDKSIFSIRFAERNTDGKIILSERKFTGLGSNRVNDVIFENDSIVWLCTTNGLIKHDITKKRSNISYNTFIRNVISSDSLLYRGNYLNVIDKRIEIPYSDGNLSIIFSTNSYTKSHLNKFRYKLEGLNDKWSEWSSDKKITYSKLFEGDYKFIVESKNYLNELSGQDIILITIHPPWYRSIQAYMAYLLFLVASVFFFIKWRTRNLARENKQLEEMVSERTIELSEKQKILESQKEELIELDRTKSNFFANISHEFRTPLTLISGPLQNILDNTIDETLRKEYKLMLKHCDKLRVQIEQYLELSRLESKRAMLNIGIHDVSVMMKRVVSSFDSLAVLKSIDYSYNFHNNTVFAKVDAEKVETVVTNILSNAFKFTQDAGKIEVELSILENDKGFSVKITDSGIGIDKRNISKIFKRFYQVDDTSTKEFEGAGIGLFMVNELVELHGGNIHVSSEPGRGSCFTVNFWVDIMQHENASDIPVEIFQPEQNEVINESTDDVDDKCKNTVLVVEDNYDMRQYLKQILCDKFNVILAENGKIGIDQAVEKHPDIVISDVMMPLKDGFQVTDAIKSNVETNHIPVILLTAKSDHDSKLEGISLGADDYLAKPFSKEELLIRSENLIKIRENLRNKFNKQIVIKPKNNESLSVDEKFILDVGKIIEDNISRTDFTVEELSDLIGMSRRSLHRKLKALTDYTPTMFIRSYRLKKAEQLLIQKSHSISECGYAVGFDDLSYFSKCFKEHFGASPSEYIKNKQTVVSY